MEVKTNREYTAMQHEIETSILTITVVTIGLIALSLALIGAFVAIERNSRAPLVTFPGIFRHRTITGINLTALFIAASLFSMFFFISLYMQQVLGYTPLEGHTIAGRVGLRRVVGDPTYTQFGKSQLLSSVTFGEVDQEGDDDPDHPEPDRHPPRPLLHRPGRVPAGAGARLRSLLPLERRTRVRRSGPRPRTARRGSWGVLG